MSWQDRFRTDFSSLNILEEGPLKVYFELFLNNYGTPLKASEIAEITSLNRSYIYDVLSQLIEKQLVTIHPGSPTKYIGQVPVQFLEHQLTRVGNQLTNLQELNSFVQDDILPKLQPPDRVKVTQLKQSYFLNSYFSLVEYVRKSLNKCQDRLFIVAPDTFITTVQKELREVISRFKDTENKLRIIRVGDTKEETLPKSSKYVVHTLELVNNFHIVIDNNVFVFNQFLESEVLSGVGLMMIDPMIADSYIFSIAYQFRNIYYATISHSTSDDLLPIFREDETLEKIMNHLFSEGWKLQDLDTNHESNYQGIIAPDSKLDELFRDGGIQYIPYKDEPHDEVISQLYQTTKENSIRHMEEVRRFTGIQMRTDEEERSIRNIECKILKFTTMMRINQSQMQVHQDHVSEIFESATNCNVVFDFKNQAAVMVWSMIEDNVYHILEIFENYLTK